MIIYFSGTGNSGYVAHKIQSVTNDQLISLQRVFRSGQNKGKTYHSEQPFVFVCPTYAWRIPRIVENFILNNNFTGDMSFIFF